MPTYEYACTRCGQHIEVFQRLSDEPLTECGMCGGSLRKVFHPAGILFKGSGFYATDNRPKKSEGSRSSSGSDGSGSKTSTSGSSDSKSAPSGAGSSGPATKESGSGTTAAPGERGT